MKRIHLSPFDLPLSFFWLSALAGLWVAYDPTLGQRTLIALTGMLLLYLFLSRTALAEKHWDGFAAVLVGMCALAGLYFVTQAGNIAYDEKIGLLDRISKWIAAIVPAFPIWRPVPNSLATFLEGGVFLAVGMALLAKSVKYRWASWIAASVIGAGLLFSASRGAWLGVLGAGLLWAAVHWKPARWLALLAVLALLGTIVFVLIRGDINALAEIPVLGRLAGALFMRPDRLEVYNHSLALLAEQPFTGIGLGDVFSAVYSRYELALAVPFLGYSHNLLLEIWLEQGLAGAAAFIWLVIVLFASLLRSPTLKGDLRLQAAAAGLTATLLHGLTDARQYPSLWTWLPFFFLLGLSTARLPARDGLQPQPTRPDARWLIQRATIVLWLIVILVILWQPLNAAWIANRAGLLQTHADFSPALTQNERSAMRSESERLFKRALADDPASAAIHRRYGLLLLEEDRFSEAIPHLELAYQAKPDHIAARKSLGLAYLWTGDLDRAETLLSGMPDITVELEGLAWQEYNDFQQYQTALYTFLLLDRLEPGLEFTREMIDSLQRRLQSGQ